MKYYLASDRDTLITIANKYDVGIEQLIFLNPHIANPDGNIAGIQVKIPSPVMPFGNQPPTPPLCPEPPLDYLDQWIPVTPLEKMAQTDYDVIIVGTGAGGGAVLWRLCEQWGRDGKRIGVIEAGDLLLPTNAWNLPTFDQERWSRFWRNPKFWKEVASFPLAFRQFLALGGRTVIWNTVTPRMHPVDFMNWPVPVKEMMYYYTIAEQIMNVTEEYSKGSLLTQILIKRLQEQGFPEATDMPLAADLKQTQYGELHSNVFFSSIEFLARALNRRPFDLAVRARAVQVLIEQGKAVGVRVMNPDKKSYDLMAKTVVLSTSTFETPRILLNSGIQDRAIGHYLTIHSRVVGTAIVNRNDFPEVLGTLSILIPRTEDRPYQIQMYGPGQYFRYHYKEKPLREEWEVDFQASGEVESRFDNFISLDPVRRDEYGVPELQVHFSYNDRDYAVIRQMTEAVKHASYAMKSPLISNRQPEVCLRLPGEEIHEMGTCRIGDDPCNAAANRYGEIFGVSGLFVADNSVIPTGGAANPTLTTVALAIRTADYIIQQLK